MHIHRLPSGNWHVIVQANGIRRAATAPTRALAQRKGAQLLLILGDNGYRPGGITVAEMIAHHLAIFGPALSPSTLAEYERVVAAMTPELGGRDVRELRAPDLTAHYRTLETAGWSVGAVRRLHELLHVAWKRTAIHYGWADINPATSARPPARAPHQIQPPEPEIVRALIDAADEDFRLYLRLSATTGARRGEVVALRWHDVDLERGDVLIHRSHVYTPESGTVVRETKTGRKGHRRIALGPVVLEALSRHYIEMVDRATENLLPPPVYVFSYDAGVTPWHPDTPTGMFAKLRARVPGAEHVRLHDLRHYMATRMLARGASAAQVGARMGHADPRTTLSFYTHWLPSRDRADADALDAELDD